MEERDQQIERQINKFEDLEVWKEGMRLATKIYQVLSSCRDFSLRDQMQRAAVSIPSNIAALLNGLRRLKCFTHMYCRV